MLGSIKIDLTISIAYVGGIGFLISMLHHLCFWHLPLYPRTEYYKFVRDLIRARLIKFTKYPNYNGFSQWKKVFRFIKTLGDSSALNEKSLWRIINIIWHRLRAEDPELERINGRNDSLTDLMHGNGSSLIAIILSGATSWIYLSYYQRYIERGYQFDNNFICITVTVFSILLLSHYISYRYTVLNLNRFVESNLFHALSIRANSREKWKIKGPLIYHLYRR
ncbi:hypothetical protein CH363_08355 [Leptospira haakeii]|uniref:Uncharacterized protein n=1 Tax=Leptospira haakeii TaxID=2023198 RepID=A0ABX4PN75_9LEPT|nr:hypothetical protein CH363_08355 [Leptospira haakeii]PKA18446.1 hypothetical protein CH377_17240 [Leptospira haakeii]